MNVFFYVTPALNLALYCIHLILHLTFQDLEPSQLVLFIQSFGIPVASMTKLLCALDVAVNTNADAVAAAVLDKSHKTYMAQLVEVRAVTSSEKYWYHLSGGSEMKLFDEDLCIKCTIGYCTQKSFRMILYASSCRSSISEEQRVVTPLPRRWANEMTWTFLESGRLVYFLSSHL